MMAHPDKDEPAESERDAGLMFDRLRRAIRLTTMLRVNLANERIALAI